VTRRGAGVTCSGNGKYRQLRETTTYLSGGVFRGNENRVELPTLQREPVKIIVGRCEACISNFATDEG